MKLVYYKSDGVLEQKTTLDDCLNIAERRGVSRNEARGKLLDPNIGEIVIGHVRLWSEESMYDF
jgi:CO dehydrogenase/acetyl-CoA synthase gamma subunit (corrinoid Fe-S protein)